MVTISQSYIWQLRKSKRKSEQVRLVELAGSSEVQLMAMRVGER